MTVKLHSTAACYVSPLASRGFWPTLRSFDNQTMWKYFVCDGDGGWITQGLINGALAICHDGSYMSEISTDISAAGIMIYCTATGCQAKGALAEFSPDADNYRGEILGGILIQLILRAASQNCTLNYQQAVIHSENKGVVNHGNSPGRSLGEKQSQADVLRCLKNYVSYNPFESCFKWVPSHQDKHERWEDCTLIEQLNIIVDRLAKQVLLAAFVSRIFIDSVFPFEQVQVIVGGSKLTGSPKHAFDRHWSTRAAQSFFHRKDIVSKEYFHLVWWDGLEKVNISLPKMLRTWLTKHCADCCGTNKQLSYWTPSQTTLCPSCGDAVETTKHLTQCPDSGRVEMPKYSINEVLEVLVDEGADLEFLDLIETYLLAQGARTLVDCLVDQDSCYKSLAIVQYRLGWDCFVEGRICKLFLQVMKPCIREVGRRSVEQWGREFFKSLLHLTHKQWLFRNARKHIRLMDGMTDEHLEVYDRVEELIHLDPTELLPKHQYLLDDDFSKMGESTSIARKVWVLNVESALAAAATVKQGTAIADGLARFHRISTTRRSSLPRAVSPLGWRSR